MGAEPGDLAAASEGAWPFLDLPALGIPEAHRRAQGAGVRVALIDTAVDARHPDLAGRIVHTHSFIGDNRGSGGSQRHGTAMAGIIGAVANNHVGIVGVAPLAQLEVFEACWQLAPDSDAAACNTFTLAKALAAALESGVPLVNLSVAGPSDALLSALVETGLRRGVVFVGAVEAGSGFPAGLPGVIGAAGSESAVPPGALAAPVCVAGFTDSHWMREAFDVLAIGGAYLGMRLYVRLLFPALVVASAIGAVRNARGSSRAPVANAPSAR